MPRITRHQRQSGVQLVMGIWRQSLTVCMALVAPAVLAQALQYRAAQVQGSYAVQPEAWQIVLLANQARARARGPPPPPAAPPGPGPPPAPGGPAGARAPPPALPAHGCRGGNRPPLCRRAGC